MTIRLDALLLIPTVLLGASCAAQLGTSESGQVRQALIGKTEQNIVACAGPPLHAVTAEEAVVLTYYQEASVLEESFPVSKSSLPKIHHGCRARVTLKGDRVVAVDYQSVPAEFHDEEHCDELFQTCLGTP